MMEIEVNTTVKIMEVVLIFDPNGTPETVVRFIDEFGDIARIARVENLNEALELIKKQGE